MLFLLFSGKECRENQRKRERENSVLGWEWDFIKDVADSGGWD